MSQSIDSQIQEKMDELEALKKLQNEELGKDEKVALNRIRDSIPFFQISAPEYDGLFSRNALVCHRDSSFSVAPTMFSDFSENPTFDLLMGEMTEKEVVALLQLYAKMKAEENTK